MLDSVLAQKLTKKIMKQLGYNINIMNKKGIIIASGDSQRIGDFHEIAYKVITNKLDMEIVRSGDSQYIGVKPGVNMPILYNDQIIGAVGISGDPTSILEFAYIVRMTVETMVEYELYKQEIQKRQNAKNVLLNALLYEEPINVNRIKNLAAELGYRESIVRVPIVINISTHDNIGFVLDMIKNGYFHTKQDISMAIGDNHIIVFKTVSSDPISHYKNSITKYIENVNKVLEGEYSDYNYFFYIGTPQNKFEFYRQAYQQTVWLEKQINGKNTNILFLMDYISEYIQQAVPFEVFENMFSCYSVILDQLGKGFFNETVDALLENNMNTIKAANQLFIHRNTIAFRLNKIKDAFKIDPVNNMSDRQFLLHLLYFNKKRVNIK